MLSSARPLLFAATNRSRGSRRLPTCRQFLLLLSLFEVGQLLLVPLEFNLELGCPMQELIRRTVNLSFHIELVALDLQNRGITLASLRQKESLLGHVLLDLFKSDISETNIVSLAERSQTLRLPRESSLHLKDVEECLSSDLTSVGSQQDVLASLKLNLVSKSDSLLEIEVLEQSLREECERVRVGVLLAEDQRESNRLQRVVLKEGELDAGFVS